MNRVAPNNPYDEESSFSGFGEKPSAPAAPKKPAAPPPSGAKGPAKKGAPSRKGLTDFQRRSLASGFEEMSRSFLTSTTLGSSPAALISEHDDDDDDEPTALGRVFDGERPASEVTGTDLYRTFQAPTQSRPGKRHAALLTNVINQFAVGKNPRYDGDERGHIFAWDVSRAMNCELPHFVGTRELDLMQTVDWLRNEAPLRGWQRLALPEAHAAAMGGQLVFAIPKERRTRFIAIVRPDPMSNGRPRTAACAKKRGNDLSVTEALGVFSIDYITHA